MQYKQNNNIVFISIISQHVNICWEYYTIYQKH